MVQGPGPGTASFSAYALGLLPIISPRRYREGLLLQDPQFILLPCPEDLARQRQEGLSSEGGSSTRSLSAQWWSVPVLASVCISPLGTHDS